MEDFRTWLRTEWDRVAAVVAVVLGAIALFLGYQGISDSPYVAEQLSYLISGGLGGLFLLGIGATLLLSADLHDEWRKLDQLEAALRNREEAGPLEAPAGATDVDERTTVAAANARPREDALSTASSMVGSGPMLAVATPGAGWSAVTPAPAAALQMRTGVGVLCVAALLSITWLQGSGQADAADVLAAVSRSTAVLFAAGLVFAVYLGLLRRAVSQRSVRVVDTLVGLAWNRSAPLAIPSGHVVARRVGPGSGDGKVILGEGLGRYHVDGCSMLGSVARARRVSIRDAARSARPCEICGAPSAHHDAATREP